MKLTLTLVFLLSKFLFCPEKTPAVHINETDDAIVVSVTRKNVLQYNKTVRESPPGDRSRLIDGAGTSILSIPRAEEN